MVARLWIRKLVLRAAACALALMGAAPVWAAPLTFLDEASFLAAAGAIQVESFESLTPTNGAVLEPSLSLADFELTAPYGNNLVVFDTPSDGMWATHGSQYVRSEWEVVWSFSESISAFGLTITDHSSFDPSPFGTNGLVFNLVGTGLSFNPALVPGEGAVHFWGVISDVPFAEVQLLAPDNDFLGLDGVLYGGGNARPVPEPRAATLLLVALLGLARGASAYR